MLNEYPEEENRAKTKKMSVLEQASNEVECQIERIHKSFDELHTKLNPCLNKNRLQKGEEAAKEPVPNYSPLITSLKGYSTKLQELHLAIENTLEQLEL